MQIVSRQGWDARPPSATQTPLRLSRIEFVVVHYSGASRFQSPRSIQNYCMDKKDHSDIDYNDLVRNRTRYIGRGWNVGSHTLNHNSRSYGICIIGEDGDATDDDLHTVLDIYEEVCAKIGRRVPLTDHRSVLGDSYTTCPGSELHSWIRRGAPRPKAVDSPAAGRIGETMIFLKVRGRSNPKVYKTTKDLERTKLMPEGTWPAIKKLIDGGHAVLIEEFDSLDQLTAFGGPLEDTP